MAAIVAQRLMSSGEHSLALAVWQRVLGNRSLPDEVRIVDALPIGPTGKVLKRELRDQLSTAPKN